MDKDIKALALLSGGLDSSLATKLILEQDINVTGIKFNSPFCNCDQKGRCYAKEIAEQFGIPFRIISKGEEYLEIIRNPKYGYGSGINPCIDCRIYMLSKARKIAEDSGANFIITGEVLGQRPMSQYKKALEIIESEAGLEGKILRPLSAKHLPETEPEIKGWVDRKKLLAIQGRSRKIQLAKAKEIGIDEFACAAGGCLLTQREFANKLNDLFKHKKQVTWYDASLLKIGRHFRSRKNKIVVGRNELENKVLISRKDETDYIFEVPDYGSPITILQGVKSKEAILTAARLTAKYSDCDEEKILVKYGRSKPIKSIIVKSLTQEEADKLNLTVD